jgi:hypothetical protein
MKKCIICRQVKTDSCFTSLCNTSDKLVLICNSCTNKRKKKLNTFKAIPSHSKEYRRNASLLFRENNFELNMLLQIRSSAKKRGLDIDLMIEDIVIPDYCPYLKVKLTKYVGHGICDTNPSIDRIDNSKGYVKGNIQIISDLANKMKRTATIEQLITFSRSVLELHTN